MGYQNTWRHVGEALSYGEKLGLHEDATIFKLIPQVDDTELDFGDGTNSFDLQIFGSSASAYITWDASGNDLKFEDSVSLMFGTGATAGQGTAGDVEMRWDGTDFDILGAADDLIIKIGDGTNSFDLWLYGNAATTYVSWDASADSMKLEDNVYLGFGTNTAGPGTKGDINITWNGTKLLVAQTTTNSAIDFGVDGAGIDLVMYGDTASATCTWDQSADLLSFAGVAGLSIVGTGLLGYGAGAGGTVTQMTNKSTGVTLSKQSGTIVMNNASLAADTTVAFTLTNTLIAANDIVVVNHDATGTIGAYSFGVTPAAGSALISVHNNTPGALGEAIQLRFAVIRGAVT